MKNALIIFFAINFLFAQTLHLQPKKVISIIPKPAKIEFNKGVFKFNQKTKIRISEPTVELLKLGEILSSAINNPTGWKLSVSEKMMSNTPHNFVLLQIKKDFLPGEAYILEIKPNKISISAGSGAGIFYAIQSLLQMMPVEQSHNSFTLPCMIVDDSPRFKWRGIHLDVGRHLFPVEFIKKYIDLLAMYKLNTFHWHLTEDQGWRIEIKQYPKLTGVGAWRKETMGDGKPYGGFYTQDHIQEVVAYAREKFITVVPEIEMPGHALAALAAHPELSCTGGPFDVGTKWGVFDDVYCAGNDKVFDFLENVLNEVTTLFPGEYIHIGGDEVPKTRWKACEKCQARIKVLDLKDEHGLQSYFIQRIEKFLNSKGKKIIGWDEILEGGLAPNAAVMSWRGIDGGIAAAKANHNVVMSPGTHCYFDHYQALSGEPKAIGGYTNLEKVYSYEPIPAALNNEESKYIMGAQANVWTEYMEATEYVEYMLLPRLCALSEIVWSTRSSRNYEDFSLRMKKHYDILSNKKYNFRIPSPLPENGELIVSKNQQLTMIKPVSHSTVYYTTDGAEPTTTSHKYLQPLMIKKPTILKAKTFLKNGKTSATSSLMISFIDSTKNGLNYNYYEGNWQKIPDFSSLTPLRSGTVYQTLLLNIQPREDFFGITYSGYIKIDEPGAYSFFLTSDDGSKLFINNSELINNDGAHRSKEVNAAIDLSKGKHPVKIFYFEGSGDQSLKLEYAGPGFSRRVIPASAFYIK